MSIYIFAMEELNEKVFLQVSRTAVRAKHGSSTTKLNLAEVQAQTVKHWVQ